MTGGPRRFVFPIAARAALAALAAAACGTSGQPPPAHAFPVQEFTLPSGVTVADMARALDACRGSAVISVLGPGPG